MTFSLRGDSIPNNGSGRVLITDINPNGDSDEDALICQSEISFPGNNPFGDWYLHSTELSTDDHDRIVSNHGIPDRGWLRNRAIDSQGHYLVRLRRASDTADEGVFTCHIPGDSNTPVSLDIYYSSES